MARGWIAGLLTGVVVSGLGLATVSLVMGPVAPQPEAAPPQTAGDAGAAPEASPVAPAPEAEPAQATTSADAAAEDATPETAPAMPEAEAAPALPNAEPTELTPEPVPDEATETDEPPVAATAPEPEALAEPDTVAEDDAPMPQAQAAAPVEPEPVAEVADPAPEVPAPADLPVADELGQDAEIMQAPEAPAPEVSEEPAAAPEEPAAAPAAVAEEHAAAPEPAKEARTPVPPVMAEPEAEQERAADTPAPGTPQADTTPPAAPEPDRATLPQIIVEPAPGSEPKPVPMPLPLPVPTPGPETVMVSPEADLAPELEADPAAAVVTDRLPRIGSAPVDVPVATPPSPALSRNALAFAPSGDQPRLAFLLIDTGPDDRATLGDLGKLPFPVTVAIDASATDAEQVLGYYRDLGAEVMLTVPLPDAATPTDVDVTIEAYAPLLDKAVAVLAEESLGFQTLGPGAVQLATNLAETGHGLITFPAGLNTGHKAALKAGVKAGLVFRDLDGEGQDGAVIRRFLDNAAFNARGEAGVIVVARTRAETLQALLEWSLGTRAQSVALAPVSAVLAGD